MSTILITKGEVLIDYAFYFLIVILYPRITIRGYKTLVLNQGTTAHFHLAYPMAFALLNTINKIQNMT
jgi:hypothetical protein